MALCHRSKPFSLPVSGGAGVALGRVRTPFTTLAEQ
jgi:hypothetical protein